MRDQFCIGRYREGIVGTNIALRRTFFNIIQVYIPLIMQLTIIYSFDNLSIINLRLLWEYVCSNKSEVSHNNRLSSNS